MIAHKIVRRYKVRDPETGVVSWAENILNQGLARHTINQLTDNADWLKVNQFFTQQVAYIAEKLDAVSGGDRTLLDNSMILFCSSMMTGSHNNDQLPVVLLGRGGGQLHSGRVLDYLGKPNRRMCSLYLSLMDKAGVHLNEFGDSRERLPGI
jgi:hypothetical protein